MNQRRRDLERRLALCFQLSDWCGLAWTARALLKLGAAAALCLPLLAQNPTPAQGRDAGPPIVFRVIKVDSQGRIEIAPGAGGCVGTPLTPCIVAGPAANGAAPTAAPVLGAGWDGTLTRTLKTDTAGQPIPSNASVANADGVANTNQTPTGAAGATLYWRTLPYIFTGSTYQRDLGCSQSIIFDGSTSGNTQLIAASGATQVRICKASLTAASSISLQFRQGTGANCSVGGADLSSVYQNVLAVAEDFSSDRSPLTGAASQAVCINLSATVRVTGQVWYAQF